MKLLLVFIAFIIGINDASHKRLEYSSFNIPKYDFVRLIGQSNAVGTAESIAPDIYLDLYENVHIITRSTSSLTNFQSNVTDESNNCDILASFVYDWVNDPENEGRELVICKVAEGGTGICVDSEPSWNTKIRNELFDELIEKSNYCQNYIKERSPNFRMLPDIWVQGELDAATDYCSSGYYSGISDIVLKLRDQTNTHNYFCATLTAAQRAYTPVVRQSKLDLVPIFNRYVTFDLVGYELQGDLLHHTTDAYIEIGHDIYNYIKSNNYYTIE
jgi:hypothetical protein